MAACVCVFAVNFQDGKHLLFLPEQKRIDLTSDLYTRKSKKCVKKTDCTH